MTLQEIKDFAFKHEACDAQFNKFVEFINSGDEFQAWQTVLGNIAWLKYVSFDMDIKEIERKAGGIGKQWYDNGRLHIQSTYKNGKLNGLYRSWYGNGQKQVECTYKNGNLDGLYRSWYGNGQKQVECTFKDGKLLEKSNYKDGNLVK